MASFFDRIRSGLAKTAQQIRERLSEATGTPEVAGASASAPAGRTVTIDTIEAVEDALIAADVGLAATSRIVEAVRSDRSGTVGERVRRVMLGILNDVKSAPEIKARPHVILVVGVNGTGKTTTVGKLANLFRTQGHSVMVCAADTFRAAAVEQLAVWAERAGVDLIRAQSGADPAAVAFDAATAARARGREILIVDTAGRLHTRANLMAELDKIRRVVGREIEGAPHEVLLVLDATVGQNGLVQAREFMAASGANGIVLTKLDGTAKGGVAVAIANDLKLPIRYVGVGEALDDLVPFDAATYVDALFIDKMVDASPDADFMDRALFLAERGRGTASPNPPVGAVIVSPDGVVVGQGAHLRAGGPHAEVVALDTAGPRAQGASLYCTLEPCAHSGRTGPCVERIVPAGITRVVAAMTDPNPRVSGAGFSYLRERGVDVSVGVREDQARRLVAPFTTWVTRARPFVIAKVAVSADGFVGRPGERVRLTGAAADRFLHRQRAEIDAIAVGAETVLADDPFLTTRHVWRGRPLLRVLFDWRIRVTSEARVFSTLHDGPVIMAVGRAAADERPDAVHRLRLAGAEVVPFELRAVAPVLDFLGEREVNSLLVEGGPRLHDAFFGARLVDRVQRVRTRHMLETGVRAAAGFDPGGEPAGTRGRMLGEDLLVEWDVHGTD